MVLSTYTYSASAWGDLLTGYNGTSITYDEIGNPLNCRNAETNEGAIFMACTLFPEGFFPDKIVPGQYQHYHSNNRKFFEYEHFHIWFGEKQ